jgi:hypothetical protein
MATAWVLGSLFHRPADPSASDAEQQRRARVAPTRIEARQVPLPPGDWRVMARVPAEGAETVVPFASMVLMRLNGREVDAAVLVQVNRLGHQVNWGLPPSCLRGDYTPRRVLYASDHDGACAYASFADGTGPLTGVLIDPAWHRAMREAVDRGWNVPATWLSVTFRIIDPMDAMQIRYLFHPWPIEQSQLPESAAWRRIHAERLGVWMETAAPRISAGFRDRLRTAAEATLGDPQRPAAETGMAEMPAMPPEPEEASVFPTARAMSYRMVASLADFGILWLYLGNAVTASTLMALKLAAQGATTLTHELVWSLVAPPIPASELPGVGVEIPLPR